MATSAKAGNRSIDKPSIENRPDWWLDLEAQSWDDDPTDVDPDYCGVESQQAEDCYTDDPDEDDWGDFDDDEVTAYRDPEANGGFERNSESDDPSEGGEYDHNTSFPELSDARTLWFVGKEYDPICINGDKHINHKREMRFYYLQTGQYVDGDVASSHVYRQQDNENYLFVRQIVWNILLDHHSEEIDDVIYAVLDDPYLNSSWASHYHGITGAAIGYAGIALNVSNPVDVIVDRIGVRPLVTYESDIEAAVEYAEKRINQRGIDFTVR